MKMAFASNEGKALDSHFGQCRSFSIYEFGEKGYRWLENRVVPHGREEEEGDRILRRVELIADCTVLFVCRIGGDASRSVTQAGVLTLQSELGSEITPQLDQLQEQMKLRPPVWLLKALQRKSG